MNNVNKFMITVCQKTISQVAQTPSFFHVSQTSTIQLVPSYGMHRVEKLGCKISFYYYFYCVSAYQYILKNQGKILDLVHFFSHKEFTSLKPKPNKFQIKTNPNTNPSLHYLIGVEKFTHFLYTKLPQ